MTDEIKPSEEPKKEPKKYPRRGRTFKGAVEIKRPVGRPSKEQLELEAAIKDSRGRPRIEAVYRGQVLKKGQVVKVHSRQLDFDIVIDMIEKQCTVEEVSGYFRICRTTLLEKTKEHFGMTFKELKDLCSESGKAYIRKTQFALAQKNPTMAIKLGEIYLGQKSEVHSRVTVENDVQLYLPDNGRDEDLNGVRVIEEE